MSWRNKIMATLNITAKYIYIYIYREREREREREIDFFFPFFYLVICESNLKVIFF